MITKFITRTAITIVGFVWPAYNCFKDLEQNNNKHLKKWCMYWVAVALFTGAERFIDHFLFWLPLYNECKLFFVVFMSYFEGAEYVYSTLVRPVLKENEAGIDELVEKANTWMHGHIQQNFAWMVEYAKTHMFKLVSMAQDVQQKHMVAAGDVSAESLPVSPTISTARHEEPAAAATPAAASVSPPAHKKSGYFSKRK